jgi:hypothetical protein
MVTIDPDSAADQRRLLSLLRNSGAFRGVVSQDIALDCLGDALRAFRVPPKPDEPLGLGAVVEDADGRRWVRVDGTYPWQFTDSDEAGDEYVDSGNYSDIAAVKVLNAGWSE